MVHLPVKVLDTEVHIFEQKRQGTVQCISLKRCSRTRESDNGCRALISGSGNVATHVAEKLVHVGALPLTLSDRGGYILATNGFSLETINE